MLVLPVCYRVFVFLQTTFCWCLKWMLNMAACGKKVSDGERSQVPDLSRWMEKLPCHLHEIPLNLLAIPGSHDSFTFYLDKFGSIAPDEPPLIQKFGSLGQCAKNIIYNWSTVQSLSVLDQLHAGIRYFDIRVGSKTQCNELFCVHGLFGPSIDKCLEEIASFLDDHKGEVVLLDFNHFYEVTKESHHILIDKILKKFDSKLCPLTDVNKVTLNFMLERDFQLIIFYHNCIARVFSKLWPGSLIKSPWPNAVQVTALLQILEENFEEGRDVSSFYVTQGVLTPTVGYVACHAWTTLKRTLVQAVAKPFVEWLESKTAGQDGINICIMDCIELENYVASVIHLNYSLIESSL